MYTLIIEGEEVQLTQTELLKMLNDKADNLAKMFNQIEKQSGFREAERWAQTQVSK